MKKKCIPCEFQYLKAERCSNFDWLFFLQCIHSITVHTYPVIYLIQEKTNWTSRISSIDIWFSSNVRMSKRFLQWTLVNICPLTDLQLCSPIHNKDLCTTCCDAFYSSSCLKLTAFCATVAQLFDCIWQENLLPCFGGPVLLGFGNFFLLRSLAIYSPQLNISTLQIVRFKNYLFP